MGAPKLGGTTEDLALIGRRDAFHVPAFLVAVRGIVRAGDFVRFSDHACCEAVKCDRLDPPLFMLFICKLLIDSLSTLRYL